MLEFDIKKEKKLLTRPASLEIALYLTVKPETSQGSSMCSTPVRKEETNSRDIFNNQTTNRMVAGFAEAADRKQTLVAEACNHPNLLVLPFRLELIRLAA